MRIAVLPGLYPGTTLQRDGVAKSFLVHRLVAIAFVPNPDNKPQVNHKNGIKSDNRSENLEWVSVSENHNHAFRTGLKTGRKGMSHHNAKLTDSDVLEIRRLRSSGVSRPAISRQFGVGCGCVRDIVLRNHWKHI